MSAADCRALRCGCAGATATEWTVRQVVEFGHREGDGFVWRDRSESMVSERWAKHIEALRTRPVEFVGWVDGWLVFKSHAGVPGLEDEVARIRWEATE